MRKGDQSRHQLYLKGTPSICTDNVSLISRIISELIRYDYNCYWLGLLLYFILFYFIKNNNLQLYFATNISVEKGISMVIRKESQN
jgi:hypothetical protein